MKQLVFSLKGYCHTCEVIFKLRRYNKITIIISIVIVVVLVFVFLPKKKTERLEFGKESKGIVVKLIADGKLLPEKYFVYMGDMDALYGDFESDLNKPIDRIRVKYNLAHQCADIHLKAYLKEEGEATATLASWKDAHVFHMEFIEPAILEYNELIDSEGATKISDVLSSISDVATLDRISLKVNGYLRLIDMNEQDKIDAIKRGKDISTLKDKEYLFKEKIVDAFAQWLDNTKEGKGEIESYLNRLCKDKHIPKHLKEKCEKILERIRE